MGNVQASSNLPPMPPNVTPIPLPTTPQKLPPEARIENPGSVEELHKKCKGMVSAVCFYRFCVLTHYCGWFFCCRNVSYGF